MTRYLLSLALALAALAAPVDAMTMQERRQYLEKLLQILPDAPAFKQWLDKTGELPPDFDAFPKVNGLPDPLKFLDGKPVRTAADWKARRAEIRQLFEKYDVGSFPPKPKLDRAVVLDETPGNGYLVRNVRLEFGPESKGTMRVQVMIPDGRGPFPVLVSPNLAGWGPSLLRRGYISCGYAGNDGMDDAAALAQLYPDYDFAALPRRAWAAGMVLDYLESLPQVDRKHVGMFGYSRDGKMATIAAAFDERISALIAGSTGVGGVLPWRLSGERGFGEGIETTTRQFPTWFVPRLRFFAGREDRLPVDGNLLVAMVAPRPVLMEWGHNDEVSNTWSNEQSFHSAMKVYKLLGQPDRLDIMRVPGFHGANDQEACLDWLDIQFGRSTRTWTNNLLFPWDFDKWRVNSKESVDLGRYPRHTSADVLAVGNGTAAAVASVADWEKRAAEIRKSVEWMLGEEPSMMPPGAGRGGFRGGRGAPAAPGGRGAAPGGGRSGGNPGQVTPDLVAWVIQRGGNQFGWHEPEKSQTTSRSITFGFNVRGDLYYPVNTPEGAKLPTVIWLHGYSYPLGYMWVYHNEYHPILALVRAGYAVLAFDQSGFGSRMAETGPFYDRYPHWSQMGRMVEDTRAAMDALEKDSLVDARRIYLFGYSMGGAVGLYTAALDARVKGVVSICGFTPMRTDTAERGTGGVARYSLERGLLPRLGFFVGHEQQIPYDFHEVLSTIAPRPALVVQPQLDRDANAADVHAAVEQARRVYSLYGAPANLALHEPWDYNRLPNATQDWIVQWMKKSLEPANR
ncbi:MAG TPA: alpha/beta fold hydrolase [Candidatus Acidoferrales bacterium]|nr:alpha/beta fold hydrolase [Candidatus Acidoferrales bacterium]